MVVYTMTKKQIIRIAGIVLAAVAAVLIIVFGVFGSVTASADSSKKPINRVERGDNKIALTFDCAWDASDTDKLLDILNTAGARATFFVTGEFCDTHPDAVRKMSSAGHSVQNGSDKNIHIAGTNINDLIADTNSASKKIETITGKSPAFYRTSYGDTDDKSLTTLEGMGYTVIGHSVDSKDLDDPDPASVRDRVLKAAVSGSVILFHNDTEVTDEALGLVIKELKQKGFELVRIEDLVFTANFIIDDTGTQRYQPSVPTALPVIYSTNEALDSAFEKMRRNLTIQQIYDLSSVGRVALVDDIKSFLNESELYAVREATYEELMECYTTLVYAAEEYGAGGSYTAELSDAIPQIAAVQEQTEEPSGTDTQSAGVMPEQFAEEGDPADTNDGTDLTYYDKGVDPGPEQTQQAQAGDVRKPAELYTK